MWSRKSALLGSMAVAMYLLGLTLRNSQLVTIAVVIFVFLTWAALFGGHADVASSGRRADEWTGEEGVALGSVLAMRKLSGARIFEDGELTVTLRMQNNSGLAKILEVRDRVPEVMRIKEGSNYILMELGPRRETYIEYTVECPLRGFYSVGPVAVRMQDPFGLFHKEKELHVYNDFLVFPKMEDLKDTFVKSRVPKIFTGAVNIRQPGPGSEFYSLREYFEGDSFRAINWSAYARSGKLMVNERERDAVSDVIIIIDSRAVSETGPVSRNALVTSSFVKEPGVEIDKPGAGTTEACPNGTIIFAVDNQGKIHYNKNEIKLERANFFAKAAKDETPRANIVIQADEESPAYVVEQLFDTLRSTFSAPPCVSTLDE